MCPVKHLKDDNELKHCSTANYVVILIKWSAEQNLQLCHLQVSCCKKYLLSVCTVHLYAVFLQSHMRVWGHLMWFTIAANQFPVENLCREPMNRYKKPNTEYKNRSFCSKI